MGDRVQVASMHTQITPQTSVPTLCAVCLFDSGHQCGMVGAARCPLIESWLNGVRPAEWRLKAVGAPTCSAYEAALISCDQ